MPVTHQLKVDIRGSDNNLDVIWHAAGIELLNELLDLRCCFIALPVAAHEKPSLADHRCHLSCAVAAGS